MQKQKTMQPSAEDDDHRWAKETSLDTPTAAEIHRSEGTRTEYKTLENPDENVKGVSWQWQKIDEERARDEEEMHAK